MMETEAMEGNPQTDAQEVVHAEVGVYGQENGFQSFKPAFVSGAGEDPIDRAWRRRMGINICHPLTEWGSPDHVFKTPARITGGKALNYCKAVGSSTGSMAFFRAFGPKMITGTARWVKFFELFGLESWPSRYLRRWIKEGGVNRGSRSH
jgi:hypothetical protein